MSQIVARRGSTTVTTSPATGGVTAAAARALTGLRKVFFTAADVADPKQLYQLLYTLQQNLVTALRPLVQSPLLGATLLTGVVFPGSPSTKVLYHRLGRPYAGYLPVLDSGAVPEFKVAALPMGVTSSQAIALTASNAGQYTFLVF